MVGHLVVSTYAPDGDAVRFIPAHGAQLASLGNAGALRVAPDGSVQLRMQGIDAPEVHYAGHAQPLGVRARDALLAWLGLGTRVPATVLTRAVDAHGRPIAYVLRGHAYATHDARAMPVDAAVIARTANAEMLRTGLAYHLAYTSLPIDERDCLRSIAREAREHRRGVWAHDETRTGFSLRAPSCLEAGQGGALIFPKLFRRMIDWFDDRAQGFVGTFQSWIEEHDGENDRVMLPGAGNRPTNLHDLLVRHGDRMWMKADPMDLTFVEH